jgi:hypothetical protein
MPHNHHLDKIQLITSTAAIALTVVSFALLIAFSLNKPPTAAAPLPPPPTEDIRLPTLPPTGSPTAAGTALAAEDNPSPPNAPDADLVREVEQIEHDFEALDHRLDALDQRLTALERTLVDEPGKAVELAVLRRDLANLEGRHDSEMQALEEQTRRELDTLRSLTWLIVGGLLSGLVSVFIQARKNPPRGGD